MVKRSAYLKQALTNYDKRSNNTNKLITQYTELLRTAEQTTSSNETIKLIRESTKTSEQMAKYSGLR